MTRILVRHDRPIVDAIERERPDLEVIDTGSSADVVRLLPEADVLILNAGRWRDEYLDSMAPGTWIQATSSGYSTFPLEEFDAGNITLTNAHGNYGPPVADHAMALVLALARGLPTFFDRQRSNEWDREVGNRIFDLEGRRLTIVGLGDIGESIAQRASGFDMTVYGTKRTPSEYDGCLPADRVLGSDRLSALLPETDFLVLIVPLSDETYRLVDRSVLEALPDSAFVINVARGQVVDHEALLSALDDGILAGAALDVFDDEPLPSNSPLWDRDDVIVTPHVGGRSSSFVARFVDLFLDNLDRRRSGDELINRIV